MIHTKKAQRLARSNRISEAAETPAGIENLGGAAGGIRESAPWHSHS